MKRTIIVVGALAAVSFNLAGCATTNRYDQFAQQCENERAQNRALAIAAGTALGAAAGAAAAKDDTKGAALGGAAGALIGSQFGGQYSQVCREYFLRYPEGRPGYAPRY